MPILKLFEWELERRERERQRAVFENLRQKLDAQLRGGEINKTAYLCALRELGHKFPALRRRLRTLSLRQTEILAINRQLAVLAEWRKEKQNA